MLSGKLKIAATGGDTVAHFDAVYDHGTIAGVASGHSAAPHATLVGNLSAAFSSTGGLTSGKIGGTSGGSAVEIGTAGCESTKTTAEKSEARGTVSAVSSTSITVGGLTCIVPASLAAQATALSVGARAGIKCSLVSGANTLLKVERRR